MHASLLRTTPIPAMGCPCRAAWLALRWSDGSRAPHGTDLVSQHVDQPRIRITCRCTTKLQVPESFWNAPVSTRVTGVVAVDDNGHDEAATHYRARSLNRLAPLSEDVAFVLGLRVRGDHRNEELNPVTNTGQHLWLPCIARAYPVLVEPHISAKAADRITQPPSGVGVLTHVADEDGRTIRRRRIGDVDPHG